MIFSHGDVPLYGLFVDPFWKFLRKSRIFFGIFVHNGGFQITISRTILGKNGFHFPKIFLKLSIFSPN